MKILIYGAGPLGSVFAARLTQAGHDVALLARGQRLADLRRHGVILENSVTGEREITPVKVVEALEPDDDYELVMVVMRKNHALQILPVLAANKRVPTILFMMNNAAGPQAFIDAVGKERVMMGFPLPGGKREDPVIYTVPDIEWRPWELPIGEVDGNVTPRTRRVAAVLEDMKGYKVDIRTDIDAWLRHHVAVVGVMSGAIYAANTNLDRLGRTRDALVLGTRAMKEATRALEHAGFPISPPLLRPIVSLPEPLLIALLKPLLGMESLEASLQGHAHAARDEMQHVLGELREVIKTTEVDTPSLDRLHPHLSAETPPLPDGSQRIPLRWKELAIPALVTTGALAGIVFLWRLKRSRDANV
jgi:ketopantoate reductase